jgi:hypothetical protein
LTSDLVQARNELAQSEARLDLARGRAGGTTAYGAQAAF